MDGSFLKFLSPDGLSDEAIANFKNFFEIVVTQTHKSYVYPITRFWQVRLKRDEASACSIQTSENPKYESGTRCGIS